MSQLILPGSAQPGDVLENKTFSGGINYGAVGTMKNNGAATITPGTANKPIPAGYHDGNGYVVGDPDLIAANIRAGVNIFGVNGALIEGKRLARGALTTDSTGTVVVTGLAFRPKAILLDCWDGRMYRKSYNEYYAATSAANRELGEKYGHYGSSIGTGVTAAGVWVITPTGFQTVFNTSATIEWTAFE